MNPFENKSVVVSTHVYATGPAFDLRDYLNDQNTGQLLFIGHPLFYDVKLQGSGYELYSKGEKKVEHYASIKKIPSVISYIKDIFLNIYFIFKTRQTWDLYIGNDQLNAFSGVLLKKAGWVKKCVYYVIDYNPKRFKQPLLNRIYHWLDQFCVRHADETWNLSQRMADGRKEYFGFEGGNQITMPIGIWFDRFNRVHDDQVKKHTLVFMGHILKKQGVQHVIDAVPDIIRSIPDFHFLVLGGGDYLPALQDQVLKLGLTDNVTFSGYVKDHHELEQLMVTCGAAIAMYEKYDDGELNVTYFADPGKVKSYLASGLPILITDVPHNAKAIESRGAGKVIENTPESIAMAVISLMKNDMELISSRKNAVEYAQEYNWPAIFRPALERLLS